MNDDQFDRLSDELVVLVFNKVQDAKSLCRCSAVSKRFASLIPRIDTLSVILPSSTTLKSNHRRRRRPSFLVNFLMFFLGKFIRPKLSDNDEYATHEFTGDVLRNFSDIKRLSIQLPCHGDEVGSTSADHSFLKWKAEFGRELQSCVVLGATSFHGRTSTPTSNSNRQPQHQHDPVLATDDFRKRIVWMISCLIAASTRHWLLKQIIADSGPVNLRSAMISDSSKQGKIVMGEEQFQELRKSLNLGMVVERTMVPAVGVKLWYAPVLELPGCGRVMKGATLIVIRPEERKMMKMEMSEDEGLGDCFEGEEEEEALREAAREMLKEKPYLMEMDSL